MPFFPLQPSCPVRPCILSNFRPALLSHGLAYEEDRDEGNEVCGHEGKGHEGNEGRQMQGHVLVEACSGCKLGFQSSQVMKKKAISRIARGKLAKAAVFQGRKEIRLGDVLQNIEASK